MNGTNVDTDAKMIREQISLIISKEETGKFYRNVDKHFQ